MSGLHNPAVGVSGAADRITVYAGIGNSDDKLTQARWSEFHARFAALIRAGADRVWGAWTSAATDPWQNACLCFEIRKSAAPTMKRELASLAAEYGQDCIAWAVVTDTESLGPGDGTGTPAEPPTGPAAGPQDAGPTVELNLTGNTALSAADLDRLTEMIGTRLARQINLARTATSRP